MLINVKMSKLRKAAWLLGSLYITCQFVNYFLLNNNNNNNNNNNI